MFNIDVIDFRGGCRTELRCTDVFYSSSRKLDLRMQFKSLRHVASEVGRLGKKCFNLNNRVLFSPFSGRVRPFRLDLRIMLTYLHNQYLSNAIN